jgi:hypothetical protein
MGVAAAAAEQAVPVADLRPFAAAARRTRLLRLALATAAVLLVAAAALVARGLARPTAALLPAGRTGVAVVDVSGSIGPRRTQEIGRAIARVDTAEERLGLVLFSDSGYELLPPGTPASELRPVERLFTPLPGPHRGKLVFASTPWDRSFRGGTRISTGLAAGLQALERARVRNGALLLVSDLADDPQDGRSLAAVATELQRRNVPVKILALYPTPSDRAVFAQLFGPGAFVPGLEAVASSGVGRRVDEVLSAPLPWSLIAIAGVLLAVLAANELYCGRLSVPRAARR